MTVREFLGLFTGVPLDTVVVLDGGDYPMSIDYNAEDKTVTVVSEYDGYEDYFTDEDEEADE